MNRMIKPLLLFLIAFNAAVTRAGEPVEAPAGEVMKQVIDRINRSDALELYMQPAFRSEKGMETREGFLRMHLLTWRSHRQGYGLSMGK
ncbi:MAG TPA: hypothetical protein ENF21_09280 [Bacteroidetes bacterium]|nr:hypothetical protein [Bacteroidota bacterium]